MLSPILHPQLREWLLKTLEVLTLGLSQSRHLDEFMSRIQPASLNKLISKSPSWFAFYDIPFEQLAFAFLQSSRAPGLKEEFMHAMKQPDAHGYFYREGKAQASKNIQDMQTAPNGVIEIKDGFSDEQLEFIGETLSKQRALINNARALGYYGQSMRDLIQAGKNGNDEGYLRAARIDPTIQSHPDVATSLSRSLMNPNDSFAKNLRDASTSGPTENFEESYHQLRMALHILRTTGVLQKLTRDQRYQFFCIELPLYGTTGKNPHAGLNTFIDRWEKSLVV